MSISLALRLLTVPPFLFLSGIFGAFLLAILMYCALEGVVRGAWNWLIK